MHTDNSLQEHLTWDKRQPVGDRTPVWEGAGGEPRPYPISRPLQL
jgi:hypothetical protein